MTPPSGPIEELPSGAYAAALCGLPTLGPSALRTLLASGNASAAWEEVLAGHRLDVEGSWRSAARGIDVTANWVSLVEQGIGVLVRGDDRYPSALLEDPQAPAVLFHLGDPAVIGAAPRVGIVGTRSATRYGLGVAAQLGAELAATGVIVVSGLALGIDGAAHEGALAGWQASRPTSAPPIAVVAGSVDQPYPLRHARLWRQVADAGTVVSECPPGGAVAAWRFPQRNRIVAALSEVLVVVECHQQGGSLHTVRAATKRGIAVGAVPGSIRSPASAGTNDLLADGCFPVRDTTDVLVALDLARAGDRPVQARRARAAAPAHGSRPTGSAAPPPQATARVRIAGRASAGASESPEVRAAGHLLREEAILDALGWEPCSFEEVLRRTGGSTAEVSLQLERLRTSGRVVTDGTCWERR